MVTDERSHPRAGRDYPGTWDELLAWFRDDASCRAYLERLRWPAGFVCPACAGRRAWQTAVGTWKCAGCARRTSVTAGTIFDKTRTPLTTWFAAVWYVTNQKYGASALGLQRVLGLGSYETAWALLHRLRAAMVRPDRDRLTGRVEADETFVGGVEHGAKRGRGTAKSIVAIAVEVKDPKGYGRTRMQVVDSCAAVDLVPFVQAAVTPGATVLTDGWGGYNPLGEHGYTRVKTVLAGGGNPAHVVMPAVHRVASLLKRWLLGTHQGAVDPRYLQAYLDEYTFRFNRRTSRRRGLLFYRLLEQAVVTPPLTAAQLPTRHG